MRINLNRSDKVVLSSRYGGLGDNLQYSTLPRLLKSLGKSVYIRKDSYYRNQEIRQLVWDLNPYIDGFIESESNAGDDCDDYRYFGLHDNHIQNVEWSHGIEPQSDFPELYYTPKKLTHLENCLVVDISAISLAAEYSSMQDSIKKKIDQIACNRKVVSVKYTNSLLVRPGDAERPRGYTPPNSMFVMQNEIEQVAVSNIFELTDVLSSCESICCLHSGVEVLSLALKKEKFQINSLLSSKEHEKMLSTKLFYNQHVKYQILD